jgi:hypothetical protein
MFEASILSLTDSPAKVQSDDKWTRAAHAAVATAAVDPAVDVLDRATLLKRAEEAAEARAAAYAAAVREATA